MKNRIKYIFIIITGIAVYFFISASQYYIADTPEINNPGEKMNPAFQEITKLPEGKLLNGYVRFDYPNGAIKDEGFYLNSIKQGWWRGFTEVGVVLYFGKFDNNQKTGYWKSFYENGNIREEGNYEKSKKESWWRKYDVHSNLISIGTFVKGSKEGYWQLYYNNGNLKASGEYYKNQKEDWWKEYTEDGNLESEGYYAMGLRNGFWIHYLYDKKECEGLYVNGARSGTWKYYDESEQLAQVYEY